MDSPVLVRRELIVQTGGETQEMKYRSVIIEETKYSNRQHHS